MAEKLKITLVKSRLTSLKTPEEVARLRGKSVEEITE